MVSSQRRTERTIASIERKFWEFRHLAIFEQAERSIYFTIKADFRNTFFRGFVKTPNSSPRSTEFSSIVFWPMYREYQGRCHYVANQRSRKSSAIFVRATNHHGIPNRRLSAKPKRR